MSEQSKAEQYLSKADALLRILPDLHDGPVDDMVIEGLRGILAMIGALFQAGLSVEEIRAVLEIWKDTPLKTLDVDAVKERVLAELGLPTQ